MDLRAFEAHGETITKVAAPLIVVLWLAFLIIDQAYFYLDSEQLMDDLAAIKPLETDQGPAAPLKLSSATLSLFGEVTEQVVEQVSAPETRLNLELQGVFTHENPALSSAIIAERGKSGELFSIGDRVPGNALLHAVESDHVLIKRGNRLEKLLFPKQRLGITSVSDADNRVNRSQTSSRARTAGRTPMTSSDNVSQTSPTDRPSPSFDPDLRQTMMRNPDQAIREFGFEPVSQGTASGYRVGSNASNPMIASAGLQPGDVVVSVNGMPVGVAMNDARLFDQVRSAGRARVEVERNGRRFFLTVPIP